MRHELIICTQDFEAIQRGDKNFEIVENDKEFQKGDEILFTECLAFHTGRKLLKTIGYVSTYEQKLNYVVLSLSDMVHTEQKQ